MVRPIVCRRRFAVACQDSDAPSATPRLVRAGGAWLRGGVMLAAMLFAASCYGMPGLDFVVLVDVSWSMQDHEVEDAAGNRVSRKGRDVQRLRWDAVKLVLDLLTEEDRILVLPFNQDCPAAWPPKIPGRKAAFIPGQLDTSLRYVDQELRDELEPKLLKFIHHGNPVPDKWDMAEANVDYGSTGILAALGTASEGIAAVPAAEDRKMVVLLLTDGEQSTWSNEDLDPKDDRLVREGIWPSDDRIRFFVERGIPVHTLGLGEEASQGSARKFLEDLATLTGGSPGFVATNLELVDKFRDLVWSLRDCWVAKLGQADLVEADGAVASNPLSGVLDFGLFAYEVDRQQQRPDQPRIVFAPEPLPAIRWRGLSGEAEPRGFLRTGKPLPTVTPDGQAGPLRSCGYSYHYYDGRRFAGDPLGTVFRSSSPLELEFAVRAEQLEREHHAYFIKRGPRFELRLESARFYRHQPLPLRVVWLNPGPNAAETTFTVRAELYPPGSAEEAVRIELVAQRPDEWVNRDDQFSAADLRSPSEFESSTDNYVLRVVVSEPLEGGRVAYHCQLPPRSVVIENTVLLKPTPPFTLTRAAPVREIAVESVYPYRGELPLNVQRTLPVPVTGKGQFEPNQLEISALPPADEEDRMYLRDGRLTLRITLDTDALPEAGRYVNGRVELRAGSACPFDIQTQPAAQGDTQIEGYTVPFEADIGPVAIKLVPDEPVWRSLSVGAAAGQDVQGFHLALADGLDGVSAVGIRPPTVELVRGDDTSTLAFSPQELWLQTAAAEPGGGGHQALGLASLEQPLQVGFRPDLGRQRSLAKLVGRHRYTLRARGVDIKPLDQEVILEIEPPEVSKIDPVRLLLRPGAATPEIGFPVRLHWIPGARLAFEFGAGPQGLPFRAVVDDRPEPEAKFAVPYTGATSPVELTAARRDTVSHQEIRLALQIPGQAEMPCGSYLAEVPLSLEGQEYGRLSIVLELDELRLAYPAMTATERDRFKLAPAEPSPVAQGAAELAVVHCLGVAHSVQVGLRTELARVLDSEGLQLELTGPMQRGGEGPYLAQTDEAGEVRTGRFLPAPVFSLQAPTAAAGTSWSELRFRPVNSAYQDRPYVIEGRLGYCEVPGLRDLGQVPFRLQVQFLDPSRLLSGSAPEQP